MKKKEWRSVTAIILLVLVVSVCIPGVTAYNDCLVDRTRAVQDPTEPALADYINARMNEAKNSIYSIFWVNGVENYAYSASDSEFINHIDSLYSQTNIVAIQSHGGTSGSHSYITLEDDSDLYYNEVNSWLDPGGYFLYAGSCYSAAYTDLGNSFVNKGFDTYLGFTGSVGTVYNSRFCSAFFNKAKYVDTSVSTAASYAKQQVLNEWGDYGGTNNYQFIGDSNLCLAPSDW